MKRLMVSALILALILTVISCKKVTGSGKDTASPDVSSVVTEPSASPSEPVGAKNVIMLEGTIGNIPVHMSLKISDGKVTGYYYYDRVGKDLKLEGTIEEDRILSLSEYDENGARTGTFDGWYTHSIRMNGTWKNTKTNTTLDFSLNVIGGIPADAIWAGEWQRKGTGRFESATLVIYNETKSSFDFQIDAFSGANMGFIDGSAKIDGSEAHYSDAATGSEITFSINGGLVDLVANAATNGQAGMGVGFDGTYTKDGLPEDTLLTQGYVSSEKEDDAFREMAGEDYELFLNTAQLGYEEDDLDGFDAKVFRWTVRGFSGTNESIVMFLPDGKLCAGVIDPDNSLVKVYTNDRDITSVPKTIQSWADGFEEMPVRLINSDKN